VIKGSAILPGQWLRGETVRGDGVKERKKERKVEQIIGDLIF